MKTILVMTDFSKRAERAAEYALHLAEKSHSNLLLFNAFYIPAVIPAETGVYPYYEEYSIVEKENTKKLEELAERLTKKMSQSPSDTGIQINTTQRPFALGSNIMDQFDRKNIWLVVMGDKSREGIISNFIFGSMTSDVIDHAFCPVILVPESAKYKYVEKIAFASNLEETDSNALQKLTDFAEIYNSDIIVVHVCSNKLTIEEKMEHMKHFDKLISKIDYFDISYDDIIGDEVPETLDKFTRIADVDMLSMVHKNYSFLEGLFRSSATKNMMNYNKIPLMVIPEKS